MSRQHFLSKDLDLLESGLFADATITCGDRTWKVHKSIICRCHWFKKAFTGDFEEAQTNNVNISVEDFSHDLVDSVISFIYSGVVNIKKLDTNDSVVDACLRLWVIADFLVLEELQNEAVNILEDYCDEKVKALCSLALNENNMMKPAVPDFGVLLAQLFRGVETAFTQYPHSVPCQQVLISFFHAVRTPVFGRSEFACAVSKAPLQFSHELLGAIVEGRVSKWTPKKLSDFALWVSMGNCTFCKAPRTLDYTSFSVDPSMSGLSKKDIARSVSWRCTPCLEKHGFKSVHADEEKR